MSVMTKDEVSEFEDEHLTANDGPMWMELPLVSAAGLDDGVGEAGAAVVKLEDDEDLSGLVGVKAAEEGEDQEVDPSQMVSVVGSGGNLIRANHATLQALLSTPISASQLFATAAASPEGSSGGLQVFTLPQATDMVPGLSPGTAATTASGGIATIGGLAGEQRFVQMIPTGTDLSGLATKYIGLIAIGNPGVLIQDKGDMTGFSGLEMVQTTETGELAAVAATENMAALLMPPPPAPDRTVGLTGGVADRLVGDLTCLASKYSGLISPHELPPNCPAWAVQLKNCEKIGDSYRGYVSNEVDLDLILTLHKQHTNSFWGTRQSPSPAKASTRLMWKSQYVPFDGIPFVNAGSRAVVMECQFGPRRKGTLGKRSAPSSVSTEFKQTCPARIYIKKVRKFPAYAVKLDQDKKSIRLAMDKAFHELREQGLDAWGEERFYVQLPTEKAHDYHDENNPLKVADQMQPQLSAQSCQAITGHLATAGTKATSAAETASTSSVSVSGSGAGAVLPELPQQRAQSEARIHPAVLEKLRQLVAGGETKLYAIRKQLRRFVVRELFQGTGQVPERHDLTMFPTVNDLKNHIHQALKDIESGVLPLCSSMTSPDAEHSSNGPGGSEEESVETKPNLNMLWARGVESGKVSTGTAMPETVTVTLTQNPGEDGHHIISRIETHLSDGTTQVSTTLTPETAQLLSRLHPGLFPAGSLLQLENTDINSSSQNSANSGLKSTTQITTGGIRPDFSVSTAVTANADDAAEGSDRNSRSAMEAPNGEEEGGVEDIGSSDPQHVMSSMIGDDPSHQLAGLVGIDADTASSISRMLTGDDEVEEESTTARGILVSQQNHHHHNQAKEDPSPQARQLSSNFRVGSNRQGLSALIATDSSAGKRRGEGSKGATTKTPLSVADSGLVVAGMDRATSGSSLSLSSADSSSEVPHQHPHLSILSAMDHATISQMVQSGAARLSIVPGHPNTLALVAAEAIGDASLGIVPTHDPSDLGHKDHGHSNDLDTDDSHGHPSDLDPGEGHGHLSLDSEHLMMERTPSSLEEDHEKLSQEKISLHITTDQEIGMAKLENQVSNL